MPTEEEGRAGGARGEDATSSPTGTLSASTETAQQPPGSPRSSSSSQSILTETSPLPIRTSTARFHSVSARSSPYTTSHLLRSPLGGDAANIPRAAQYHAVGMPARHPLGLQSGTAHSSLDVDSLPDELAAQGLPTATATALSRPLPPFAQDGPGGLHSANRGEASSAAATVATTEHSQSCCLTPLALDDDDEDNGFGMSGPASSTVARASARMRTTTLSSADMEVSDVAANDIAKCPICLSTICEAFMTACGHSFCYSCISKHLSERLSCPSCCRALTSDQIYPNFALNQLINSHNGEIQRPSSSSIVEQICNSVESNQVLDVSDIDTLLLVLQQKKLEMRSFERRFEMLTMRNFLVATQARKLAKMEGLRAELAMLEEDLLHVTAQLEGNDVRSNDSSVGSTLAKSHLALALGNRPSTADLGADPQVPNALTAEDGTILSETNDGQHPVVRAEQQPQQLLPPAPRNHSRRVEEHYSDLENYYFNTRMRGVGGDEGLAEFLETLTTFARYEQFRPVATLRYGDGSANAAIVASIEFDRDEEVFAVAGVTRKIKIFDYANVIEQADTWNGLAHTAQQRRQKQKLATRQDWWNREVEDNSNAGGGSSNSTDAGAPVMTALQYPTIEFTNRSKISCLSFNPYIKSQLACSDYDGTVSLWDVSASGAPILNLGEHEKRTWSVDFSHVDPTRLCSGSDDGKVKIWTTNKRTSVMTIEGKANVCCVRFNQLHGNILIFGSADHNVHCFDLRMPKQPLCVLRGHRKAVSYTRFLSPDEIISASTDSSLKLWNMRTQECARTFSGHTNEKNFVGLTTSGSEWIACGSENNTMYSYYRNLSQPAVTHRFGNCNPVTGIEQPEDDPSLFVSAVCWKNKTNTLLSANSQGIIKVLELV
ncbi:hypothetical protein IWW37_001453 [Coemansia sp. RSA 2050]|nr:hypothetical protein IWW37_001453 [Coemansia sp. RSA 2050]